MVLGPQRKHGLRTLKTENDDNEEDGEVFENRKSEVNDTWPFLELKAFYFICFIYKCKSGVLQQNVIAWLPQLYCEMTLAENQWKGLTQTILR